MIKVRDLTKVYGYTRAVNKLSFDVSRGEILGFLGPNGAGKTTTIRMLTCYLPPTSGTVEIAGRDILRDSMAVREMIGYLPEKTPLYQDLTVRSYLDFVASIKGTPGVRIPAAIDDAVEKCGLESVHKRVIGNLSKGYQQRVGIAQAIINDPEVLILDEPTIGLDPRQIHEIRRLIQDIGKERTIILSSHILPEVNQICDRIIIMNKGKLAAVDSPENLKQSLKKYSNIIIKMEKGRKAAGARDFISSLPGVITVTESEETEKNLTFIIETEPESDLRPEILRSLVQEGFPLLEIYNRELSLEDIFIQLVTTEN
ncbi:MAG: ATP-binding cassette domain-containing protein [Candidatus Krumholzibacteriales bacterium]